MTSPTAPGTTCRAAWPRALPWAFVLLQLAWWSYGLWPVAAVEGDEQGVIFGVTGMLHDDPVLLSVRYLYEVQPGSYHLLATLVRLTGAPVDTVFGLVTMLGAAGFALGGAWLLHMVFEWPLGWMLVAMLNCQETTAAGDYMNTSAFAGAVALLGVVIAVHPGRLAWLWSGALLAVAGWLRADSLLLAPACLGLAFFRFRLWRPVLIRTTLIAATATLGFILLYWLSGTSVFQGADTYAQRGYALSDWRTLAETSLQLLSPLVLSGALAGVLILAWRREYALGLLVLSGSAATLAAYGSSLTTPKYFYYLIPFALMPAVYLVGTLLAVIGRQSRWPAVLAAAAGILALMADGLLGLRTLSPGERFFTVAPTWASICEITPRAKTFALVVGPGEVVLNADGFRVRTGHWFAPLCWHREKVRLQAELATVRSWLAASPETTLLWSGWVPYQLACRELFAAGFRPADPPSPTPYQPYQGVWRKGAQVARLAFLGYVGSPYQPPGPAPARLATSVTYLIGDRARQAPAEIADGRRWHLVSAVPEGFISLHQRR